MVVILHLHQVIAQPRNQQPAKRLRAFATLTPISQLEKLRLLGNYGSHSGGGTSRGGG
jgi:hypothetical protein